MPDSHTLRQPACPRALVVPAGAVCSHDPIRRAAVKLAQAAVAAVTQIRHKHSNGRAYYEKKLAEGKTHKEALRALKRRISDAIYAALVADARRAADACAEGPGGQPGNRSPSRAAGSHPARRLFGQATPGPATTLRPGTTAGPAPSQPNGALRYRATNPPAD